MNIVKQAGVFMLLMAVVNIATAGSLLVSIPLTLIGMWVFLLGGLSG